MDSGCYGGGSIAGAVIGTFFATLVLVVILFFLWSLRRKRQAKNSPLANLVLVEEGDEGPGGKHFTYDNPSFVDDANETKKGHGQPGKFHQNNSLHQNGKGKTVANQEGSENKKMPWGPLSFLFTKNSRNALDDSVLEEPQRYSVALKGHDFTGLGFSVCGNMRDGIYIKDMMQRGPAAETRQIIPGDRITGMTVSFKQMVLEDALTLLSYASPYDVTLDMMRLPEKSLPHKGIILSSPSQASGSGGLGTTTIHNSERVCHPFFKSQSIDDLRKVGKEHLDLKVDRVKRQGNGWKTSLEIPPVSYNENRSSSSPKIGVVMTKKDKTTFEAHHKNTFSLAVDEVDTCGAPNAQIKLSTVKPEVVPRLKSKSAHVKSPNINVNLTGSSPNPNVVEAISPVFQMVYGKGEMNDMAVVEIEPIEIKGPKQSVKIECDHVPDQIAAHMMDMGEKQKHIKIQMPTVEYEETITTIHEFEMCPPVAKKTSSPKKEKDAKASKNKIEKVECTPKEKEEKAEQDKEKSKFSKFGIRVLPDISLGFGKRGNSPEKDGEKQTEKKDKTKGSKKEKEEPKRKISKEEEVISIKTDMPEIRSDDFIVNMTLPHIEKPKPIIINESVEVNISTTPIRAPEITTSTTTEETIYYKRETPPAERPASADSIGSGEKVPKKSGFHMPSIKLPLFGHSKQYNLEQEKDIKGQGEHKMTIPSPSAKIEVSGPGIEMPELNATGNLEKPDIKVSGKIERPDLKLLGKMEKPDMIMSREIEKPDLEMSGDIEKPDMKISGRLDKPDINILGKVENPDFKMSGKVEKPDMKISGRLDKPDINILGKVENPDFKMSGKVERPDLKLSGKIEKPDMKMSGEIGKLHVNILEKVEKPDFKMSGKVDKQDVKISGKVDKPDTKMSGNVEKPDVKVSGKVDKPDFKIFGKVDKPDLKLLGKVEKSDLQISGKVEQPDISMSGKIEKPDMKISEKFDKPDMKMLGKLEKPESDISFQIPDLEIPKAKISVVPMHKEPVASPHLEITPITVAKPEVEVRIRQEMETFMESRSTGASPEPVEYEEKGDKEKEKGQDKPGFMSKLRDLKERVTHKLSTHESHDSGSGEDGDEENQKEKAKKLMKEKEAMEKEKIAEAKLKEKHDKEEKLREKAKEKERRKAEKLAKKFDQKKKSPASKQAGHKSDTSSSSSDESDQEGPDGKSKVKKKSKSSNKSKEKEKKQGKSKSDKKGNEQKVDVNEISFEIVTRAPKLTAVKPPVAPRKSKDSNKGEDMEKEEKSATKVPKKDGSTGTSSSNSSSDSEHEGKDKSGKPKKPKRSNKRKAPTPPSTRADVSVIIISAEVSDQPVDMHLHRSSAPEIIEATVKPKVQLQTEKITVTTKVSGGVGVEPKTPENGRRSASVGDLSSVPKLKSDPLERTVSMDIAAEPQSTNHQASIMSPIEDLSTATELSAIARTVHMKSKDGMDSLSSSSSSETLKASPTSLVHISGSESMSNRFEETDIQKIMNETVVMMNNIAQSMHMEIPQTPEIDFDLKQTKTTMAEVTISTSGSSVMDDIELKRVAQDAVQEIMAKVSRDGIGMADRKANVESSSQFHSQDSSIIHVKAAGAEMNVDMIPAAKNITVTDIKNALEPVTLDVQVPELSFSVADMSFKSSDSPALESDKKLLRGDSKSRLMQTVADANEIKIGQVSPLKKESTSSSSSSQSSPDIHGDSKPPFTEGFKNGTNSPSPVPATATSTGGQTIEISAAELDGIMMSHSDFLSKQASFFSAEPPLKDSSFDHWVYVDQKHSESNSSSPSEPSASSHDEDDPNARFSRNGALSPTTFKMETEYETSELKVTSTTSPDDTKDAKTLQQTKVYSTTMTLPQRTITQICLNPEAGQNISVVDGSIIVSKISVESNADEKIKIDLTSLPKLETQK